MQFKGVEGSKQMISFLQAASSGTKQMFTNKVKLVFIGDGGVGKTSLIKSFERDAQHKPGNYPICFNGHRCDNKTGKPKTVYSTCAIETSSESVLYLDDKIQYQVWDFAGQPEYNTIHQVLQYIIHQNKPTH